MRRRAGVLGLVIAVLAVLWWWRGSRETTVPETASKGAVTVASHGASTQAKTAALGGRVTRVKDGAPIADAVIAITLANEPGDPVPPEFVVTSLDGRWTTPIGAGTYRIGVAAAGFIPANRGPIVVVMHATSEVSVALSEGGVSVRGVVSDIGGGPISAARVAAVEDGAEVATFTRRDGSYLLTLDVGYHAVEYSHDDYVSDAISCALSVEDQVHNVALVPAGTIRGIVVARDTGKPVPNAVITAGVNRPGFSGEAESGADGTFVLHQVSAGDIPLYANAPGYVTTRPTVVTLGIGDSVDARLEADHGFSLRGHITRKDRPTEAVAGVVVTAHTDAPVPDSQARAASGPDGAFEIVGLAPARYKLSATGDGILDVRDIDANVTHDIDDVRITVSRGITLRGHVDPPEHVKAYVSSRDDYIGRAAHITVDANGAFIATNIPPGNIVITATSATKSGDLSLRVGTSDETGLVVPLHPLAGHLISGRVVDESNTPIPSALVRAGYDSTLAGDDGTFELRGDGVTRIFATFGGADRGHDPEPITSITVDRDIRGLVVKIPSPQSEIRGHVVGVDGKPANDVWVAAGQPRVLTSADGSFTLRPLRTGTYDVHADSAKGDANAVVHKVATGSSIEITLQSAATLHGRVTMAGSAVPHYELRCQGADYYERRIDAVDGTFSFDHVRSVEGRPVDCRAATEDGEGHALAVFSGTTAQVAIELVPFATITGAVLDVFTKQPITDAHVTLGGRTLGSLFTTDSGIAPSGRFELDHVPSEDVYVLVMTRRGSASEIAHPTAGQPLDLGTIFLVPDPRDPADLQIYLTERMSIMYLGSSRFPELRVGDTIVAINGVPVSAMQFRSWNSLLNGNAERGQTYSLTLARGVTVNVTAE